jgi:formylglycine-generating enzyme required for sulfatase activity
MVVGAAAALLGAAGLAMYLGAIPTPAAVSALKSQFDRMSNDKSERLQRDAEAQRQADEADRRRVALLEEIEQKRRQEAEEAARTAAAAPGQTFRDCNYGCPEMVVVPSGSFTVGSPVSEAGRDSDEGPQHTVTVSRPFAVGKFEVTFDEWQQCVAGGGCQTNRNPGDNGWGKERRPVTKVSWSDAREYVAWLALKTGKPYRLLSEAEWEYAARAGTTTLYAWGDPIGLRNANCSRCGSQWDNKQTAPAGSFAPNAFGLYDMHGNVWEWVEDCWHDDYVGAPSDGSVWTAACADKSRRVLRGGSWNDVPELLRSANRIWYSTGTRNPNNGFRVARSLP